MTEQSQRGATQNFRTARVFDGSSTDGRPHVDRQMLDEREASQVLSYLEAAPVVHTTNGLGLDRIDPMRGKAVPLTWLTDGSWVWPGSVSYYLSNYALPPDPELLTHIRRRNFRPPAVDAATRQAAVKAVAGRPPTDPPTHAPVPPATPAGSVFTPAAGAASSTTSGPLARPTAGLPAAGPSKAGSPRSGPPASGPSASGPPVAGPSVAGPSGSGPSGSGPSGSGPSGSGPSGSGPSGSGPSGSGPSTGPNAVPPQPATTPAPPSAPPAGGDLPAGDRAPLAAAGRVPPPAPVARPGASAPGRRPSGGSGSAPTITSRPAGPRLAGTRPPTVQPPGGSPPPVQSPPVQSPPVQSPAAQSPAVQSAAAHTGHGQPPGARGPGFPAGAYQAGSPPPNHLGAGPAPAGEPPVRGAAPGPRPAAGPPPVSAPPVSSSDDSANFDRLRSAAGALGVSKRAYRIGAGAEGAWSVLRDGSKWAVFRTELGVRHDLASFTNSQHATAYLIGQLYLTQGGGAPGSDQARRPAASTPPAASTLTAASTPPVTATTRPAPVVPAANTPAPTPTSGTAVSSTGDIARPGGGVRPASAVADDVAVADATPTVNGQPAAEKAETEPPGPAVQASDQAAKPAEDKAVSGGSGTASKLVDTGAASAAAGQRADQDSGPVPRDSTTARETRAGNTDSGSTRAGSADEPGGSGQQSAASDALGPAAASPDSSPATKTGPTPATEPAPAGPTRSTAQSQAPAAPAQGTSKPGPTTPAASSERSGTGGSTTGGSATSGPDAAERAGRPAAVPDDRLGLKAGPPAGSTAGALDGPTTGPGPSVAKPEAAGRDVGRPAPPSRPAGTAGGPARPDSPGAGSIFTPVVPAIPPAAAAGPPRTSAAATPAGSPATPGRATPSPATSGPATPSPATPGPTTPGPAADRGPASPGWSIQPLPGEPPLTLYRDKHPVVLKPDTEIDRYGEANGNVVYAARTKYPQRSLPTEWSTFTYHAYRLVRPLEVLTGVAVPWFDQPGGGTVFILPRSIAELLADGALVEVRNAVPNQ